MTKPHDSLDDFSEDQVHEFIGSDSPYPMRRYPPAADGIKLTRGEARQALEGMPNDLSPEQAAAERDARLGAALLAKREMAAINAYAQIAMAPEVTADERREAMQIAIGTAIRLGGISMRTHQAVPMYIPVVAPIVKAAGAANARKSLSAEKARRDSVIDEQLRAHPDVPTKRLLKPVNDKLRQFGLDEASLSHLYDRRKRFFV